MKHGSNNDSADSNGTAAAHTIRLRGPCKLLWLRNGTQQAEVRVQIPCEIAPDLFQPAVISADDTFVLQRNFGMPTGLDESQCVTLAVSEFENATRVSLNRGTDEELALDIREGCISFDATKSLRAQNWVEFEFQTLPAVAGQIQLIIK